MKRFATVAATILIVVPMGAGLSAVALANGDLSAVALAKADAAKQLAELSWLEGNWTGDMGGGRWEARYTGSDGGLVLSTNKMIAADGALRSWEYEQFRVHEGAVIMQPYPGGKMSPVFFTLTTFDPDARMAVFENPEHDFPQILTYHRVDDRTLNIKVQARRDGKLGGFELQLELAD